MLTVILLGGCCATLQAAKAAAPFIRNSVWVYGATALYSVFIFEQGSLRKEFPKSIGGSDICYFCKKRVYVMERLSAEGHFFHRECFKCEICSTTLRLGIYAFDVDEGNVGAI